MATPIIQSTGSVSGVGVAGQGRNDLVPGETVTLSDAESLNSGHVYFWEFDDAPIGTSPVLIAPTTATPSFVVDANALLAGSYRVRCTVDGSFRSVEVFAVPLAFTGARIPSFEEETQYDAAGNMKGWHESQTVFMRSVDAALGAVGASSIERSAAIVVPNGTNSIELELGIAVYPGSFLAIAGHGDEAVTGGAVNVSARVNGVTKFTTTLNLGSPVTSYSIQIPGAYPLIAGDRISVLVAGASLVTASTNPLPVAINVVMSNSMSQDILSIPDASSIQKGITKLSVAPAIPTEPVAVGSNDARVPTQDENNALVGTAGLPSSINKYVTDQDSRNTDQRTSLPHAFAGALHTASTFAQVSSKISDATLVISTDSRLTNARTPTVHGLAGSEHSGSTLAAFNVLITDTDVVGTADARLSDSRAPTAHALGGALHTADTFTNFKTKVTGAIPAATDLSQQYTKNQRSAVVALTDAATIATDLDLGNIFEVTITATRILGNPTNIVKGMAWTVIVNENATGGFNLTYGGFYDWGTEGVPDLTTLTANKTAVLSFLALSTTQIASTCLKGFS